MVSSTLLIRPGLPLVESSGAGDLMRSLFWYMSSYQNMKSSAVNGAPSDHFMPLRRNSVVRRPSALVSQPFATLGAILGARHVPEQQLVGGAHAVAVLAVAGAEKAAPPGAAIFADAAQRLDHHRLLRDALLHRRQLAGLDEFGQRRRLAELLRPLRGIGDDRRVFQFSDQAGLRQIRLLGGGRTGEQHRQGNQKRSHGVSPSLF